MDMRSSTHSKRRRSRDDGNDNSSKSLLLTEDSSHNSLVNGNKVVSNRRTSYSSRHSTSSPEMMHSPIGSALPFGDDLSSRRRSSSRSSASASPLPLNSLSSSSSSGSRRNSVGVTDSIPNNNCNNNNNNGHSFSSTSTPATSSSSAGASNPNPSTKSVGVSVNLGKGNVKSNSLPSAGAQHILPNGHQHQQHTPGMMTTASTNTNNINSHHNNNNGNSAAINLGHGHIGTIAGPPSVSISCGGTSGAGVNHSSSSSTSPAVNAPTTCTNKGVPSLNNQQQQQQHLHNASSSPQPSNQPEISPNLPMTHGLPEPQLQAGSETEPGKSSNSSTSGNDGNKSSGGGGIRTGPNSPSSTSSTGGSKGETQPNPSKTGTDSTGNGNSSSDSKTTRIKSLNVNGTEAVTRAPSNESETQLFRVLQRANLLSYFDMMIELGGDDVQQLCDAGEQEFLEIMGLIGMASKPLHVRRFQKALQEWMTQPSLFQSPVLPPGYLFGANAQLHQASPQVAAAFAAASGVAQIPIPHMPSYSPGPVAPTSAVPMLFSGTPELIPTPSDMKGSANSSKLTNQMKPDGIYFSNANSTGTMGDPNTNPFAAALALQQALVNAQGGMVYPQLAEIVNNLSPNNNNNQHQQHQSRRNHHHLSQSAGHHNHKVSEREKMQIPSDIKIPVDQLIPSHFLETRIRTRSELSSPSSSLTGSPHPDSRNSLSPVPLSLQDHEVQKLADAAIDLIRSKPQSIAEPKFSSKRKTSGDYELILRLSESDPRRMEEVRRVAAVYGRAEAKRKTLKPLSMHELAINEAAAQLCKHVPALLTKREELLRLSRDVVRDSGLPYAAISSTFSIPNLTNGTNNVNSGTSLLHSTNNNNDINTKSKYEEINRHSSSNLNNRDISSYADGNNSLFSGIHAKRCRLDGSLAGIEIQEYNGRPLSLLQTSPSPPATSNGMQITELRNLPPRRSPSDDHLPSPLELVTVTTSELRKSGGGVAGMGSKSASSVSSMESNSPPIRKPYSVESADDLTTSSSHSNNGNGSHHHQLHHLYHGMRASHQPTSNSVKMASLPVNGGSISILNHNGSNSGTNLHNQHFSNHHRLHHQYNRNQHHHGLPIKSEPTMN